MAKLVWEGGKSFAHANRKALYFAGKHVGTLYVHRSLGWYGGGTRYSFHPTEEGEALGFKNHYERYLKTMVALLKADSRL